MGDNATLRRLLDQVEASRRQNEEAKEDMRRQYEAEMQLLRAENEKIMNQLR